MLSMRERIFMNQEEKKIKVRLENKEKKDLLVFELDSEVSVCLNDENGQSNLKDVFAELLRELILQPIKLDLEIDKSYKTGLYIDVCTEYIKDLNREINRVSKNIPEKLAIEK